MDYSQILASQLVSKEAWIDNEDAFYDRFSLDGIAKLRGVYARLRKALMQTVSVAPQVSLKRIRYN